MKTKMQKNVILVYGIFVVNMVSGIIECSSIDVLMNQYEKWKQRWKKKKNSIELSWKNKNWRSKQKRNKQTKKNTHTHTHTHKTYSSPDGEHCYIDRHRESYEDDGRPERLHENTFSALRLLPKTKVVKKSRKIINSAADKNNIVAYASRYE